MKQHIFSSAFALLVFIVGCSDHSRVRGSDIFVQVIGLEPGKTIVLELRAGSFRDTRSITGNSSDVSSTFSFNTEFTAGISYQVNVIGQPDGQTCIMAGGSFGDGSGIIEPSADGSIQGDDVLLSANCVENFSIGGSITNLNGTLQLQNNGDEILDLTNVDQFTFLNGVGDGLGYNVTVFSHPSGQTCTITNGSGTVPGADVTNIGVNCADIPAGSYTIGGTVSNLVGTLVLQNNGSDDLTITANGSFMFVTPIADGQGYSVSVVAEPFDQTCQLSNDSGTVSGANVRDVAVICGPRVTPGTLDTTFGSLGYITHNNAAGGNGIDRGLAIATDANDNIFVVGTSYVNNMVIWKYLENGTLDISFSSDGIANSFGAAGGFTDTGRAITIDAAGNVYVTGNSQSAGSSLNTVLAIWKFDNTGNPDPTFGVSGFVTPGIAGQTGFAITLDSIGRIVVAGEQATPTGTDMKIWRYNATGSLDTNFGNNGVVTYNTATGRSIVIDQNQDIVVTGGVGQQGNDLDMAIWRFNNDGIPDTTFDNDGLVVHDGAAGGTFDDIGYDVTIDASDRIVVTGGSFGPAGGGSEAMAIWRYLPNGILDTTFDGDGIVIWAGGSKDRGHGVMIDDQNRVVVAGVVDSAVTSRDMFIWRYNDSGTPDSTFDGNGVVFHHNAAGGNGWDEGLDLAIDTQGRIVVTGSSDSPDNSDMAIWRYTP
jgi:uncharacterized delta-60 repeat protein